MFFGKLVTFEALCENPEILSDPNIVVKINDRFYNFQAASPILFSLLVFKKPPTADAIRKIEEKQREERYSYRRAISSWFSRPSKSPLRGETPPPAVDSPEGIQHSPQKQKADEKAMVDDKKAEEKAKSDEKANETKLEKQNFFKALRLTSDQLKQLNLKRELIL